jgi:hypothetical protein
LEGTQRTVNGNTVLFFPNYVIGNKASLPAAQTVIANTSGGKCMGVKQSPIGTTVSKQEIASRSSTSLTLDACLSFKTGDCFAHSANPSLDARNDDGFFRDGFYFPFAFPFVHLSFNRAILSSNLEF